MKDHIDVECVYAVRDICNDCDQCSLFMSPCTGSFTDVNFCPSEMDCYEPRGAAGAMGEIIELRRAPGTCCPEPSCDHHWHSRLHLLMPHEIAALECEGCGKECAHCAMRPKALII